MSSSVSVSSAVAETAEFAAPRPVPVSPSSSVGSVSMDADSSSCSLDLEGISAQLSNALNGDAPAAKAMKPMKVLFLSADTGGGHRASAESLANQLMIHFPGSSYDLLDIWTDDGIWPYNALVKSYKHMSANPASWRLFYHITNSPVGLFGTWHSTVMCEKKVRKRIASYKPDVIVSVHPAMNHAPLFASKNIAKIKGTHIPFFTVVTDLASAHLTWFHNRVDKLYLASKPLNKLARKHGNVPQDRIFMTGLPIRHDFAVQSEKLGDRNSPEGKAYQRQVKSLLGIDPHKPMVLLMGGGEGVGGLAGIVDELYTSLTLDGVDATLCVVCGRNEQLKAGLEERDWEAVLYGEYKVQESRRGSFCQPPEQRLNPKLLLPPPSILVEEKKDDDNITTDRGCVTVVGLGFVTRMAEFMVAANVLVSKAGPGTISEAASVGLPVMLTSFLPGQEAGNVDFVLENGFGNYCEDPVKIGEKVSGWLQDDKLLQQMSRKATETGHPNAAAEIVLDIGTTAQQYLV